MLGGTEERLLGPCTGHALRVEERLKATDFRGECHVVFMRGGAAAAAAAAVPDASSALADLPLVCLALLEVCTLERARRARTLEAEAAEQAKNSGGQLGSNTARGIRRGIIPPRPMVHHRGLSLGRGSGWNPCTDLSMRCCRSRRGAPSAHSSCQ